MADDKKIAKNIKFINYCLKEIENKTSKLEMVDKSKEKEKLSKQIESLKTSIVMEAKSLNKNGGNLDEIINCGNEFQIVVLKDLFQQGLDMDNVGRQDKRNDTIKLWKSYLKTLREKKSKYSTYADSLSITEKKKNKIYKYEEHIGWKLLLESNISNQNNYNDVWNYARDLDNSPEFSEEEKNILRHCVAVREEYIEYKFENRAAIFKYIDQISGDIMDKKQSERAEKIKKTVQSIVDAFLVAINDIEQVSNLSDEEMLVEAKRMTRDFLILASDDKKRDTVMTEYRTLIQEKYEPMKAQMGLAGKIVLHGNNRDYVIMSLVFDEMGIEKGATAFILEAFEGTSWDAKTFEKLLELFTFEDLGVAE